MHNANIHLMTLYITKHLWIRGVYPMEGSGKARGTTNSLSTTHQKITGATSITIEFFTQITHQFVHIIHNPTHAYQSVIHRLYPLSTGLIIRTAR